VSSQAWLDAHADSLGLSGRVYDKILRVARTIADLAGSSTIEDRHLQEAIAFRKWDQPATIRCLQASESS
jgi:magnesium chelatase family protein